VVYHAWPGRRAFGWANRVTLVRAALVALFIGALGLPEIDAGRGILLATLALIAIVLDGVDGWIARLSDSVSEFGARFDMEVDALLILALSVAVVMADQGGWWVVSIGLMRYAFLALGASAQWWRRELPPSVWRKGVCVAQGVILAAVLLPWLQPPVTQTLLALALAALGHSFGRDALWLIRNREPDRNR
jgi:phosphatidylglycerophosphate synthase